MIFKYNCAIGDIVVTEISYNLAIHLFYMV